MIGRERIESVLRSWLITFPDLHLVVALSLIAGCAACEHTRTIPRGIPLCPEPTIRMVIELEAGALDDAPHTEEYLGRLELYCVGIDAM